MHSLRRFLLLGLAALPFVACTMGDASAPQYSAVPAADGGPAPDTRTATDPRDAGPATRDSSPPRSAAQRGAQFVEMRGCPTCHQSKDPKDGVLSGQSMPRPGTMAFGPNLTPDPDTGIGSWSDEIIVRAIRTGKDDQGAPLCAPMPHFEDMGDPEGRDIVAYLRGLEPVKRKAPDSQCAGKESADDAGTADDAGHPSSPDSGADAGCVGFAAPGAPSTCHGCGTHACQANGCYGGFWCDVATAKCHAKPATCP